MVFFFKKKKLIEIDEKVNRIAELLDTNTKLSERLFEKLEKLEDRVDQIEKEMVVTSVAEKNVDQILEAISAVSDGFTNQVHVLDKNQGEMVNGIRADIEHAAEAIKRHAETTAVFNKDIVSSASKESNQRMDLIDSNLNLLLLKAAQIEKEMVITSVAEKNTHQILEAVSDVKDGFANHEQVLDKNQSEMVNTIKTDIEHAAEAIQRHVATTAVFNKDNISSASKEFNQRMDLIDSNLKLLLLNSVMDQIEKE